MTFVAAVLTIALLVTLGIAGLEPGSTWRQPR